MFKMHKNFEFAGGFMGLSTNLRLGEWAKNKTQLLVPFSTNAGDKKPLSKHCY